MTGTTLRHIRLTHGHTQESFGRELGVSLYTVQSNESKRTVSAEIGDRVRRWQNEKRDAK